MDGAELYELWQTAMDEQCDLAGMPHYAASWEVVGDITKQAWNVLAQNVQLLDEAGDADNNPRS